MNKVTTNVQFMEFNGEDDVVVGGKNIVAHFELINANDDQFEISLERPFVESSVYNGSAHAIVYVDIVGYDRRDPEQEIVIQREEEIELSPDDIESAEIQFDVVHRGALDSEPLPMLTDYETMMCLGEDAKVVVRFELK